MERVAVIIITPGVTDNAELVKKIYEDNLNYIPKWWKRTVYYGNWRLELPLPYDNPKVMQIVDFAKANNLSVRVIQDVHYTKKEIESIAFFRMEIPYVTELEGTDAKYYGTQFYGGCSVCGMGQKLISDVFVDRKLIKKHKIGIINPCIFVHYEVKNKILNEKFSGIKFNFKVNDFKKRPIEDYYVMEINNVLPPMNNTTLLIKSREIEKCEHEIIYLQSDIHYKNSELKNFKDFNLSCEYVNNYRLQEIIVSAKVRNFFATNKIRVKFTPICFEP